MARRINASASPKPKRHPSRTDVPSSLEDQLASVVEQDGVLLVSPRGARKRRVKKSTIFIASEISSSPIVEDEIAALDYKSVETAVRLTDGSHERRVHVRFIKHDPSPFVLSLQTVLLRTFHRAPDERVSVAAAAGRSPTDSVPVPPEIYATVSSDLTSDQRMPAVSDQFTPPTFEAAYRAVYGRFDRIHSVVREVISIVKGWFQRVEHVERDIVDETRTAMTVLEVPQFSMTRALVGFVALAFVVTLPANAVSLYRSVTVQESIATAAGTAAVGDLADAANAGSILSSANALKKASTRFREADAMLSDTNGLALGLASVLPQRYRSARALLEVGDKASEAARLLALGLNKVFTNPSRRLDERLDALGAYSRTALVLLSDASKAAATINPSMIPIGKRSMVTKLLSELNQSTIAVREFSSLSNLLAIMVGKNYQRDYLVIFQNNTELRPTGGFMGSFAEVRMDKGAVTSVHIPSGGTYALKGQLTVRVAAPEPLRLINPLWQFQDANWSPDFPTAAKRIQWFWSKAGQPTIDGVITVNATFAEKILALTGPINMPKYGKIITADNFLFETQKAVELNYDTQANTPKKFIGDLAAKLISRLKSMPRSDWMHIAALVSQSLESKDVQIYLTNPSEEKIVERYGWNSRLKSSAGDELTIIEANIAGKKTDGKIQEQVDQNVTIHNDGSIQTALTMTRTHTGIKGELFSGARNVSYVRFYVPKGSTLVSASGFQAPDPSLFKPEDPFAVKDSVLAASASSSVAGPDGMTVSVEGDRTVFGGWLQLDPGKTQTIILHYKLPFTTSDILAHAEAAPDRAARTSGGAYLLLLTSQSGKSDRILHTTVTIPKNWKLTWSRQSDGVQNGSGLGYSGLWNHDLVLAAILTPPNGQTTSQKAGAAR